MSRIIPKLGNQEEGNEALEMSQKFGYGIKTISLSPKSRSPSRVRNPECCLTSIFFNSFCLEKDFLG